MSSAFIESGNQKLLHDIINEEDEQLGDDLYNQLRNCSISSTGSHIDIHGQPVSSDVLVALLDRPSEMKDLFARNSQYYDTIKLYITETQGSLACQRFQDILFKSREKLPDRAWMNQISLYLNQNTIFLSKFKEIVGYDENDKADDTVESSYTSNKPNNTTHRRLSSSHSTSSINSYNHTRRRSRRLSNMSASDIFDDDDSINYDDVPKVPENMFNSEDQFYNQQINSRRRRSSYHSIQSEPHPTFVDAKIDEVDEANIDDYSNSDESDHLADLLDTDDDEEDVDKAQEKRVKDVGAGYSTPQKGSHQRSELFLIRLRDNPEFQKNLYNTHASFFRKAGYLLSIAPSSTRFSATIRRNSILEDAMPPSPVTELEEPRFQTCVENEQDLDGGNLAKLVCCTRRQQSDDVAWLNSVMEALAGWPELMDRLYDIVQESLEDE